MAVDVGYGGVCNYFIWLMVEYNDEPLQVGFHIRRGIS